MGYKSRKNVLIEKKFVFAVNNFDLFTLNCNLIISYKSTSKSWIVVCVVNRVKIYEFSRNSDMFLQ